MRLGAWDSPVQARVAAWRRANKRQQFGQADDDWVWNGATACTHTVWQTILGFVKGWIHTLNRINELAGMPRNARNRQGKPRGMYPVEALTLIQKTGLRYEVLYGASFATVLRRSRLGPVMYAMRYGSAPEWKGYRYGRTTASAPYALKAGKTQLTGFEDGAHAVVLLGRRQRLDDVGDSTTTGSANLRTSPSTTAGVWRTVPKGTALRVYARVSGGSWKVGNTSGSSWYKVRLPGSTRTVYVATGLATRPTYRVTGHVVYRHEPNHGSPARPEKPAYDIVTQAQAEREYLDYRSKLGRSLVAFVPKE